MKNLVLVFIMVICFGMMACSKEPLSDEEQDSEDIICLQNFRMKHGRFKFRTVMEM